MAPISISRGITQFVLMLKETHFPYKLIPDNLNEKVKKTSHVKCLFMGDVLKCKSCTFEDGFNAAIALFNVLSIKE